MNNSLGVYSLLVEVHSTKLTGTSVSNSFNY